jgi:surface antigen
MIPEYIDENIYYLGQSYCFAWQNINQDIFFNGNYLSNNEEFDQYLKRFGYKFVNKNKEHAGYAILKNKNIVLSNGCRVQAQLKNFLKIINLGLYHLR